MACNEKSTIESNVINSKEEEDYFQKGYIVLIFQKPPVNNKYKFDTGVTVHNGGMHELNYIDDRLLPRLIALKYSLSSDTVVIKTQRRIIEVEHAYRGMDKISYLFHNGDTALFTYNGLKPKAEVLNRKVLPYDVNYEMKQREIIQKDDFPALAKAKSLPRFYPIRFRDEYFKTDLERADSINKENIKEEQISGFLTSTSFAVACGLSIL
jgi:hypothetical protein